LTYLPCVPLVFPSFPTRRSSDLHPPPLAHARRAADHGVFELDDHVVALRRAVPERDAERVVPAAEDDALGVGRDQRAGDAEVLALAEQVLGVAQLEREAQDGRDGGERDVALLPVQAEVERAVVAAEDHAGGGDGALYLRLNWKKRYITLAAISTVLDLAF